MRRLHLLLVTLALVLAGACSGAGAGDRRQDASPDPDGTLTIAVRKSVENLNPFEFRALFNVQTMVFEPLVQYGDGGDLEPALAESWEESPDGRTVTFHLRHDVEFSDGQPWTAEAAKLSLDQWVGKEAYSFLGSSTVIDEVEAVDDHTLRLRLDRPYFQLLQELTLVRPVRFLSPGGFDGDGDYDQPIGTGPFVVESNGPTETVLTRNENYWGEKPKMKRVVIKVIPDARTRLTALRAGDVDLIGGDWTAPLSPPDAASIRNDTQGAHLVTEAGTTTLLLGFNPESDRPTSDPAVRRAVELALDRELIAEHRYFGMAEPAGSLFPATVPTGEGAGPTPPDLEQAAQVLEEAGWVGSGVRERDGRPLRLKMLVTEETLPGAKSIAEVVQSMVKPLGIAVDIAAVDHATAHDAIPEREYDLALFFTIGAPYDPVNTLTNWFLSTVPTSDGKIWTDPEGLDPLIRAVLESGSEQERQQAYEDVYTYFEDSTAFVPLVYPKRVWAHGDQVHDVELPPTEYDFPLQSTWVS